MRYVCGACPEPLEGEPMVKKLAKVSGLLAAGGVLGAGLAALTAALGSPASWMPLNTLMICH